MGEHIGESWSSFDKFVDHFTSIEKLPNIEYDPIVHEIMNAPFEELINTDSETLDAWAFKLCGYALHLHSFLTRDQLKLEWCEDTINYLMAKSYDYEAMIKYELRRHLTIKDNDFAAKVEKIRNRLAVRVSTLKTHIHYIEIMADKLTRMSNRRKYHD